MSVFNNRVNVYNRQSNSDTKPLLDMQDVLQNSTYQDLVIIGDFNLPGIDWLHVRAGKQLVNEPTRECNILDLVLTTSPEFVSKLQSATKLVETPPEKRHLVSMVFFVLF